MNTLDNMSPEEIMELQKKNCIFCKIIAKEIPSHEIYSDEKVSVILDINPANEGHCLILPKQHYQILPQLPDDLIGYLSVIAKRTSKILLRAMGIKGTTIFIANGAIAGQKAPHFMLHVIPRKNNDMFFQINKNAADSNKLEEIKVKISNSMAGAKGKTLQLTNKLNEENKEVQEVKKSEKVSEVDLDKISKMFG